MGVKLGIWKVMYLRNQFMSEHCHELIDFQRRNKLPNEPARL